MEPVAQGEDIIIGTVDRAGVITTLARWHAYHRRERDQWRARLADGRARDRATVERLAGEHSVALTALFSASEDLGIAQDVYELSVKLYEPLEASRGNTD